MTPILRRVCLLVVVIPLAVIVLPAVHELGHFLPGVWLGAQVRDITWTLLGGHAPKVSFVSVSRTALPWIDAGGIRLPTAIGWVLVCTWAHCCPGLRSQFSLLLLICGAALSCNALGAAIESFGPPTSYAHLRGLAQRWGFSGSAAIGFQVLPTLLTAAVFYCAFFRFRRTRKSTPVT